MEEFEGRSRGIVQPSKQHVAPYVKVVEWGFGMRGLRMLLVTSIMRMQTWLYKKSVDKNSSDKTHNGYN